MRLRLPPALAACLLTSLTVLTLPSSGAYAQQRGEGEVNSAQPQGVSVDEIVRRFAAKEKQFKEARDNYTYRQTVKVETLDGDTVDGEFQMVFDVTFDE